MSDVARAARSVDFLLNYTWHSLEHKGKDGLGRITKKARATTVAKNVSASHREIVIEEFTSLNEDPVVGLRAAATAARHIRRCPGFVDEDEAFGIKIELAVEPVLSALQDVRPILLCSVRGLFFHVIPCRSKNRHNVATAKL